MAASPGLVRSCSARGSRRLRAQAAATREKLCPFAGFHGKTAPPLLESYFKRFGAAQPFVQKQRLQSVHTAPIKCLANDVATGGLFQVLHRIERLGVL